MRCDAMDAVIWCDVMFNVTWRLVRFIPVIVLVIVCLVLRVYCTVLILFVACKLCCSYTLLYSTVQKSSTDSTDSIVLCRVQGCAWHGHYGWCFNQCASLVSRDLMSPNHSLHARTLARTQNQFSQHSNNMVNQHHLFIIKHQHDDSPRYHHDCCKTLLLL